MLLKGQRKDIGVAISDDILDCKFESLFGLHFFGIRLGTERERLRIVCLRGVCAILVFHQYTFEDGGIASLKLHYHEKIGYDSSFMDVFLFVSVDLR